MGTGYLPDLTIGYGAVAGQGKCFGKLWKPEEKLGHKSKPKMTPIQPVELLGNVADFFFTIIHFYKPNLQLRNMMGIAR